MEMLTGPCGVHRALTLWLLGHRISFAALSVRIVGRVACLSSFVSLLDDSWALRQALLHFSRSQEAGVGRLPFARVPDWEASGRDRHL